MEKYFLMQVRTETMAILFADYNEVVVIGKQILLHNGAVAYYRGGGWWKVAGYHWAREDVAQIKNQLLDWKKREYWTRW